MDDETLIREFEARTLPFAQWRHATHIRVAWIYLSRFGYAEALVRIRANIAAYNRANARPDTELYGFHETITEAWMRIVADAMARHAACTDSLEFLETQPHIAARTLLRVFYSPQRIVTPEAKRAFVTPDLAPLPAPPVARNDGVRRADRADLPAMIELTPRSFSYPRWLDAVRAAIDAGGAWVAQRDGVLAGYATIDLSFFHRAFIASLYVRPEVRRSGLGRALMLAILDAAPGEVFTSTNQSNTIMQSLLGQLGFVKCGEVDQLDPGDPEWFYRRA